MPEFGGNLKNLISSFLYGASCLLSQPRRETPFDWTVSQRSAIYSVRKPKYTYHQFISPLYTHTHTHTHFSTAEAYHAAKFSCD